MRLKVFDPDDAQDWDALCAKSDNGTWLQSRRFLDRDGVKAADASICILERSELVALLPAAWTSTTTVESHPHSSFGGLIHRGQILGHKMIAAMSLIFSHYQDLGCQSFVYRAVPTAFQTLKTEDDVYALSTLGGERTRMVLNCVIDLRLPYSLSTRKLRNLRKGRSLKTENVSLEWIPTFYSILADNLRERYQAKPTHSLDELLGLLESLQNNIRLFAAFENDQMLAGCLIFCHRAIWHAQYIASTPRGRQLGAVDSCLVGAMQQAKSLGIDTFSFGNSNDPKTGELNDGLYLFKSEFGGRGAINETWQVRLK